MKTIVNDNVFGDDKLSENLTRYLHASITYKYFEQYKSSRKRKMLLRALFDLWFECPGPTNENAWLDWTVESHWSGYATSKKEYPTKIMIRNVLLHNLRALPTDKAAKVIYAEELKTKNT